MNIRLVSIYRDGKRIYPKAARDVPHTPRIIAKRLLEDHQRHESPSSVPCPRTPYHTALALAGSDKVWCPSCQSIVSMGDDDDLYKPPSRLPLYATLGLLAFWAVALWMST